MTLGQVKTEEKSNEMTAIPKLLEVLEVPGCIVSLDAMGCQKDVAAAITDQGADYVLTLKSSQGELRCDAAALFDRLEAPESSHESVCGDHGRVEVRQCEAAEVAGRGVVDTEGWPELRSVCRVRSERHVDEELQAKTRYFNALLHQQPGSRRQENVGGRARALAYRKQAALGPRCCLQRRREPHSRRFDAFLDEAGLVRVLPSDDGEGHTTVSQVRQRT